MKNTLNFENRAFDHIMVIQGGSNNLMCVGGGSLRGKIDMTQEVNQFQI